MVVRGLVRVVVSMAGLVTLYYLLPFDRYSITVAVMILLVGLLAFIALIVYQVRAIIRSAFPGLRAIEALATSVPLFVILFASTYIAMANLSAASFGGHLSHTDGLYFTVTVLATVGFGDITPKTDLARLLVTGQMMTDLVIVGLAIKTITGAVSRVRQRQSDQRNGSS